RSKRDWSSDVCSSDLAREGGKHRDSPCSADLLGQFQGVAHELRRLQDGPGDRTGLQGCLDAGGRPAAEHGGPADAVAFGKRDDFRAVAQVLTVVAAEGDQVYPVDAVEGRPGRWLR